MAAAVGAASSAIIGRMATLSRSEVEHVAYLARLGLTDEELDRLHGIITRGATDTAQQEGA